MSAPAPLLVVGDALLDHDLCGRVERLAPDAPVPVVSSLRRIARPGGAALAACLAAADGRQVTLVTALGDDEASASLCRLLPDRVRLVRLPLTGALSSKTRVLAEDRPLLRLDDGDGRAGERTDEACRAIAEAGAVLVADYGRGTADVLREALRSAAARVPVVWDPHPRGRPPVPGVRLATPCASEARAFAGRVHPGDEPPGGSALHAAARHADTLVRAWRAASVAVTLGGRGALLSHGETPLLVPSPVTAEGDACGAGDRFAATAAGSLADGELTETAVRAAVHAATRYVAEGGARALAVDTAPAAPPHPSDDHEPTDDALRTATRVRAAGGTVVAAGGCFDLLHAGHVALLEAARRTGDCLVVCVNSDASVRRRKGSGRPLVPLADRVRVLRALECVDAVAVFDEDTPERLLGELRPHIWAKGGDYALAQLPEASLVESWGGQVVLFPYLDGRSTTGIAERAAATPQRVRPAGRRSG
ncbi:D-beta-D-heptose 7-phosphate kinase/D-beta-D-heptose 1-phosphate adenosyltransferase [Streptomyces sp. SAI-135]|uniref:D-glycero-beta-D-manno-heptose 1-phosphate adenylyltransferase n=1 Tax=unclassified Streptomyces TaxID=2593676 RepID=UPI002475C476|nr:MULTISPECIES: D-glycero-beta-D-manno-heptose 1-phosphate adenylyltransferase [unclassified Streptomyces]MDH6516506.1 D-beta-D-heptose 7-phosphate kinase/D-beta-D-heptose 1-phosphate adenosyltransferase [Streptomyces sp. SAI-090]MDH6619405.1 D-beta-D-heptose 7-phosphate kinase/D-beta-D-heptose 1-phosphate adenosyltransferase [Streptomyces sp. SAI-135]